MKTQEEILDVQVGLAEKLRKPLLIPLCEGVFGIVAVKETNGSSVPW